MSSSFELYVVDEHKLPTAPSGTDQERYDRLVAAVRQFGARWHQLELTLRGFAVGLQTIDAQIGNKKFLPIFAFNNSPANVLGNDGDCPDFGYFTPKASRDLAFLLGKVPENAIDGFEREGESVLRLYWAFRDGAEEAARRGHALAVLHDAPSADELARAPRFAPEQFAAYSHTEGARTWYTIERRADRAEAIVVEAIDPQERTLHVRYSKTIDDIPLTTARDLIERVLLLDFLRGRHASSVERVAYTNTRSGETVNRLYPRVTR